MALFIEAITALNVLKALESLFGILTIPPRIGRVLDEVDGLFDGVLGKGDRLLGFLKVHEKLVKLRKFSHDLSYTVTVQSSDLHEALHNASCISNSITLLVPATTCVLNELTLMIAY